MGPIFLATANLSFFSENPILASTTNLKQVFFFSMREKKNRKVDEVRQLQEWNELTFRARVCAFSHP